MDYWTARLTARAVAFEGPFDRFGEKIIAFSDPDGMRVELAATAKADASRAYQANLVAIDMSKQIDNLSMKILA